MTSNPYRTEPGYPEEKIADFIRNKPLRSYSTQYNTYTKLKLHIIENGTKFALYYSSPSTLNEKSLIDILQSISSYNKDKSGMQLLIGDDYDVRKFETGYTEFYNKTQFSGFVLPLKESNRELIEQFFKHTKLPYKDYVNYYEISKVVIQNIKPDIECITTNTATDSMENAATAIAYLSSTQYE